MRSRVIRLIVLVLVCIYIYVCVCSLVGQTYSSLTVLGSAGQGKGAGYNEDDTREEKV